MSRKILFFVMILLSTSLLAQKKELVFVEEAKKLSENVNSGYTDAEPKLSPGGERLYFCRRENPENLGSADIWYSELNSKGEWGKSVNIGSPVNDRKFNQVIGIRSDGNAMLIYGAYNNDNSSNIFISYREGKEWQTPQPMKFENFMEGSSFSISADFNTLIVSAPAYSGGKQDLFVSFRKDEFLWSEPVNMGKVINSPNAEIYPTLAGDNKTMYFSSNGHDGYGSYDIFMTKRQDSTWTNWSEPINMGNKINTSGFDADFTIDAKGEYAYISSNFGNASGEFDIYSIFLPEEARPEAVVVITGKVIDQSTNNPLEVEVKYQRVRDGKNLGVAYSNAETGGYKIVLPYGEKYSFTATEKGYAAISEFIDLEKEGDYSEIKKDIAMIPLKVGSVVRMNNIFFDSGKSDLQSDSYTELNNVITLLKKNKTIKIEIAGHTDNTGSDGANLTLSENRAKMVAEYIVAKGIDKNRISFKGYGEKMPLATNSTEEGKRLNRRVEFKILEM